MSGVEFDASEVRELAADFRQVPALLARHAKPVVSKGALNIKKALTADLAASQHFKGSAHTVGYDLLDGGFTAEIGPSAGGSAGTIANIAYFGGINGGGGTVADPRAALEAEAPRFQKALLDLAEELLR